MRDAVHDCITRLRQCKIPAPAETGTIRHKIKGGSEEKEFTSWRQRQGLYILAKTLMEQNAKYTVLKHGDEGLQQG